MTIRDTRCDGCQRPIQIDTSRLGLDHYLDGYRYHYTCYRCGHVNERAVPDDAVDQLIEHILR